MPGDEANNLISSDGPHGIAYTNVSFGDPAIPKPSGSSLAEEYQRSLVLFPHRIAAIMQTIAYASPGSVVLYCNAGKDRTGIIVALLLELVGVARPTIVADYALSVERLRLRDETSLAGEAGERAQQEQEVAAEEPRAEVMQVVLEYLDERYRGTEMYLREAGVASEAILRLRERLLPAATGL
jgi:protein-tyrosine phosphatase